MFPDIVKTFGLCYNSNGSRKVVGHREMVNNSIKARNYRMIVAKGISAAQKKRKNDPMTVLYILLLALLQGLTEFLPVSSFGILCMAEKFFGMERSTGLLCETMVHLGTAASIIFIFRKDLKRIGAEFIGMLLDLIGNLNLYIHNKRTGSDLNYARIVHGTYRKFTALLVVSMIPSFLLGYAARRLAVLSSESGIVNGIGFLIGGIVLLVTDLNNSGGEKGPRDTAYHCAMWMGICQGIAVFPGLSRMGMTVCAALLGGCSRKFAVRFSVIMSFPMLIGAFVSQAGQFASAQMTPGLGVTYAAAMILAGLTGCLSVRFMINLVQNKKLRVFAFLSFAAGILALASNFM